MDHTEYTTLVEALRAVPDPRKARGQRYPWDLLLTVIAAALASHQPHGRAISQWVHEHADELADVLVAAPGRIPSEATLRRTLQAVDVVALDACVQALWPATEGPVTDRAAADLTGIAIDGKAVRGVRAHGRTVHLLSLVRHDGRVLAQTAVADKTNEIGAAPGLLAAQSLHGRVVTMDALLTQRALARQIQRQGGHYLMAVKDNKPVLRDAISTLFAVPPWLPAERTHEVWETQTMEKGHGRLETRTLLASTSLNAYVRWPGVGQVVQRTCRRVQLATGEVTEDTSYAITSLSPAQASPAVLERLWRGHWTIENRVHHVRDVAFNEDATRAYVGNTAHTLASLRNALLNLIRAAGWTRIPDALRYYGARVARALTLIGVLPT
jgi:predicted transposase YbfD/YdcC